MEKRVSLSLLLLFLALCFSFGLRSQAAYPAAMSATHPLVGYPLSRVRKITVYTDATYREFTITKHDTASHSLYVTCREGKKTIRGWVKRNTFFFTRKFKAVQSFANKNVTLYRGKSTSLY